MPSFDPQPRAVVSASPVVSTPLTGRQVSDEIEKMSSVERPIRGQRRGGGLNWTNRNTVLSWFPMHSHQRMKRNIQTHAGTEGLIDELIGLERLNLFWVCPPSPPKMKCYFFQILQPVYCISPFYTSLGFSFIVKTVKSTATTIPHLQVTVNHFSPDLLLLCITSTSTQH